MTSRNAPHPHAMLVTNDRRISPARTQAGAVKNRKREVRCCPGYGWDTTCRFCPVCTAGRSGARRNRDGERGRRRSKEHWPGDVFDDDRYDEESGPDDVFDDSAP